jgi:cation transporter-like permease
MKKLTGILAGLSLLFVIVGVLYGYLYGYIVHGGIGLVLFLVMWVLLFATAVSLVTWGIVEVVRRNRP